MSRLLHFEDFPVGQRFDFGRYTLSENEVGTYAAAFDPRGLDEAPLMASPWLLCAVLMRMNYDGWMYRTAARGAPGVDAVRWLRPVGAGDALTGRYTVTNARVSKSRPALGLVQYHYELIAEDGAPALSQTNYVMVSRRQPDAPVQAQATEPPPAPKAPALRDDAASRPRVALGSTEFTTENILAFARAYDPQPFHVDEAAAVSGPFGRLAASGWHTAASWMRAYMQTLRRGGAALPTPKTFLSIENMRWSRPAYRGDRMDFDFMPIDIATSDTGETVVTSHNRGVNQNGVTAYEFTATMTIADKHWPA